MKKGVDFPKNLIDFETERFKKISLENVGIILFEKEILKIGIYSNKTLCKKYKLEKKEFNYELGLSIFSYVEKIFATGCETIDEIRMLENIAREEEIDLQIEIDEELGMKLNECNAKNKNK